MMKRQADYTIPSFVLPRLSLCDNRARIEEERAMRI